MIKKQQTKLVHEGEYAAEVDVELIYTDDDWSPYLSLDDANKLDDVRKALTLEAIWLEIRAHLEKKKNQIRDEIINYPPPIPACDVHFNYLLEERTRITQELSRVPELPGKGTNPGDSVRLLREFIDSCDYIDDALKARWEWQAAQLAKQPY